MRGWIGVQVNPMTGVFAASLGMMEPREPSRSSYSPSTSWHQLMTSVIGRRASFEAGSWCADGRQLARRLLRVIALLLLAPTFAIAGAGFRRGRSFLY